MHESLRSFFHHRPSGPKGSQHHRALLLMSRILFTIPGVSGKERVLKTSTAQPGTTGKDQDDKGSSPIPRRHPLQERAFSKHHCLSMRHIVHSGTNSRHSRTPESFTFMREASELGYSAPKYQGTLKLQRLVRRPKHTEHKHILMNIRGLY